MGLIFGTYINGTYKLKYQFGAQNIGKKDRSKVFLEQQGGKEIFLLRLGKCSWQMRVTGGEP